jgi:two-component system, NarL family, sensor histidine kinase UhpB
MSLLVKTYLANAAVLVAAVLVLMASPATVSNPVSPQEAAVLVLGLAALGAVNWWWTARLLRPLSTLRRAVERRDAPDTVDRVEITGSDEFSMLAAAYNGMLDRLSAERRSAARVALEAQEAERGRVAAELHDEVGQALTGVLLRLSLLGDRLPEPASGEVTEMRETVRGTLDEVRAISTRLRPGLLRDLGLLAAVRGLAREASDASGIDIRLDLSTRVALDDERELVCYRVVQEALTNVLRHSGAATAWVTLRADSGHVLVEVRDDGVWKSGRPGTGLAGMRERAHLVSGTLSVEHGTTGTNVVLQMPSEAVGE